MPKVTVIPATKNLYTGNEITDKRKKKVAAYARVSTDMEEQISSYNAQIKYYTQYIKSRDDWAFVGMYSDEGVTGTNTKNRDGFNRMISDAIEGRIDLIITKSVSRFARNTVDSLTTVRKLKAKGVEVYFEKENIYTLDSKGELLITIMSSLAQEESRSISENVTWGKRKSFADGKICLAYSSFLGYRKGEDGLPEIVEEEAEIVRRIYREYLQGKSTLRIATELSLDGIPSPEGKAKWPPSTVASILRNEKYKGSALLQKWYTADFLTKRHKKNEGELPQYYIENSHPAIISPEEFELVQAEHRRRSVRKKKDKWSGMIICGDCGCAYGRKIWHSTDKFRSIAYRCNGKYDGEEKCKTPSIKEEEVKGRFIRAYNNLKGTEPGEVPESKEREIEREIEDLREKVYAAGAQLESYAEKSRGTDGFWEEYGRMEQRCDELEKELKNAEDRLRIEHLHAVQLEQFRRGLNERGTLEEFDEELFELAIEYITVYRDGSWVFTFKDGREVEIEG